MRPATSQDQVRSIAGQMARQRYWQHGNLWAELDLQLARPLSSYDGLHAELTFTAEGVPALDLMAACLLADVTSIYIEGGVQVGFDVGPMDASRELFPEIQAALRGRYRRIDYGCYLPLGADEV